MAHTYDYIDPLGAGGGSGSGDPYTQNFNNTSDWGSPSGGFYNITILQSTHEKGTSPQIQTFESIGGGFNLIDTSVQVNASGDVTISVTSSPDNRFTGRIVIL